MRDQTILGPDRMKGKTKPRTKQRGENVGIEMSRIKLEDQTTLGQFSVGNQADQTE